MLIMNQAKTLLGDFAAIYVKSDDAGYWVAGTLTTGETVSLALYETFEEAQEYLNQLGDQFNYRDA